MVHTHTWNMDHATMLNVIERPDCYFGLTVTVYIWRAELHVSFISRKQNKNKKLL
jgi:hypothetical protein